MVCGYMDLYSSTLPVFCSRFFLFLSLLVVFINIYIYGSVLWDGSPAASHLLSCDVDVEKHRGRLCGRMQGRVFDSNFQRVVPKIKGVRHPLGGSATKLLRGTMSSRTYGRHKTLYITLLLPTIFGPINYAPPYYCNLKSAPEGWP